MQASTTDVLRSRAFQTQGDIVMKLTDNLQRIAGMLLAIVVAFLAAYPFSLRSTSRPSEPDDLYTNAEKIPLCHAGLIELESFAEHVKRLRGMAANRGYDVDQLIEDQRKGGPDFFSSQIIVQDFQSGSGKFDLDQFHGFSDAKDYRNVTAWNCQPADYPIAYFVGFRVRKIEKGTIFVSRDKGIVNVISLNALGVCSFDSKDDGCDDSSLNIKVRLLEGGEVLCPDIATECDQSIFYSHE
jgi:hypothetical protein